MLYNCLDILFPSHEFSSGSTSPLSVDDFRTVVLLPELAVHLIMQDLGHDRATAIDTLLASIKYGNSRFPLGLEDQRACNLMIREAYRNIRPNKSHRDLQEIRQSGDRNAVGNKRRRVLRVMIPSTEYIGGGGMDELPNERAERNTRKGSNN